jgi:hypothetical protein
VGNPSFEFGSFVWLVTSVLLVLGIPSVKARMGVSGVSTYGTELAIQVTEDFWLIVT